MPEGRQKLRRGLLPPTIRYDAFRSRRIHGKGYLRVDVGRERAEANIGDVIGQLNRLSEIMKGEKLRVEYFDKATVP